LATEKTIVVEEAETVNDAISFELLDPFKALLLVPVRKLIDKQVIPRAPSKEFVAHDLDRENCRAIGVQSPDKREI
jgi:hypothetical protein